MDESLKPALEFLRIPTEQSFWLGLSIIVVVALAGPVYVLLSRWHERKRQKQERWSAFYLRAQQADVNTKELRLLRAAAAASRPESPAQLLRSQESFDDGVDRYLAAITARGLDTSAATRSFAAIRSKLSLDPTPGVYLRSTRSLLPDLPVRVLTGGSGGLVAARGHLVAVDESSLTIALDDSVPQRSDQPGARIQVQFGQSGDAEYLFESTVVANHTQVTNQISVAHASQLDRIQQRDYFRVATSIDLTFEETTDNEGTEPAEYRGRIVNLSGGGATLVTERSLLKGDVLRFALTLPTRAPLDVSAKIVHATTSAESARFYRLEFIDLAPQLRDRIIDYVSGVQRGLYPTLYVAEGHRDDWPTDCNLDAHEHEHPEHPGTH